MKEVTDERTGETHEDFSCEAEFCQKIDRLLTGDIRINVQDRNIELAASCKRDIFINFGQIRTKCDNDEEFVTSFKGLNLHEMGHVKFTNINYKTDIDYNKQRVPALDIMDWHQRNELKRYINVLEDSKIENLMSATYPNASKYYLWNILKWIVNHKPTITKGYKDKQGNWVSAKSTHEEHVLSSWLLLYGRRFVKRSMVKTLEAGVKLPPKDRVAIKKVFDEYITTHEKKRQIELAIKLKKILEENKQTAPPKYDDFENTLIGAKTGKETKEALKNVKDAVKVMKKQEKSQQKGDQKKDQKRKICMNPS